MSALWTKKHLPHPPGAGRVKLRKNSRNQTETMQPTPSLNPSPAGPEIRPRADRVRHSNSIRAFPFGTLFSHRFWDVFFPVFFKIKMISGSHLGSILAPFSFNSAYLFRTLFLHAFFIALYRFLEPWILLNHRFTMVKRRFTQNYPTRTI